MLGLDLLLGTLALLEELVQHLQVLDGGLSSFVLLHPGLLAPHAAHDLFGFLGVVPELGILGQLLILLDVDALPVDGEVPFEGLHAVAGILDLVCRQHGGQS